jgi:hypothetical protein
MKPTRNLNLDFILDFRVELVGQILTTFRNLKLTTNQTIETIETIQPNNL